MNQLEDTLKNTNKGTCFNWVLDYCLVKEDQCDHKENQDECLNYEFRGELK